MRGISLRTRLWLHCKHVAVRTMHTLESRTVTLHASRWARLANTSVVSRSFARRPGFTQTSACDHEPSWQQVNFIGKTARKAPDPKVQVEYPLLLGAAVLLQYTDGMIHSGALQSPSCGQRYHQQQMPGHTAYIEDRTSIRTSIIDRCHLVSSRLWSHSSIW